MNKQIEFYKMVKQNRMALYSKPRRYYNRDGIKGSAIKLGEFIANNFYDDDGNFLPDVVTKFVLRNNNFDKYAQSIARQAVNAERKRVVESQISGGAGVRDTSIPNAPTEFQQRMEFALS